MRAPGRPSRRCRAARRCAAGSVRRSERPRRAGGGALPVAASTSRSELRELRVEVARRATWPHDVPMTNEPGGPSAGRPAAERPGRGPSAGACRAGAQAAPDPPRRAGEGQVRDRGEARLVLAQGEQQLGDPVAGRQRRVGDPHAPAVHVAARRGATSSAPASPTSQTPSAPRSSTRPVRASRLAGVVADEIAEQAERRRARARDCAGCRRRRTTFAPRWRRARGSTQAWTSASAATGASQRPDATSSAAVAQNGTTWASVVAGHSRRRAAASPRLARARQATPASSGSPAPPAAA